MSELLSLVSADLHDETNHVLAAYAFSNNKKIKLNHADTKARSLRPGEYIQSMITCNAV